MGSCAGGLSSSPSSSASAVVKAGLLGGGIGVVAHGGVEVWDTGDAFALGLPKDMEIGFDIAWRV